jgi:hypothetical protein
MLTRLRSFARKSIDSTLYWSGAGALFEVITQPAGAIILMYQSVAPGDAAEFIELSDASLINVRIWFSIENIFSILTCT